MENLTNLSLSAIMSLMTLINPDPNDKISTYELPAVAGLWQIELDNPIHENCQERYNFGRDGKLTTTSGKERTIGSYRLQHFEDFPLPVLAMTTKFDNNETDCSGNQVNQAGNSAAMFVKFDSRHDPKKMQWCSDPDGQVCTSTLTKVLP